jgi:hypothetical protein
MKPTYSEKEVEELCDLNLNSGYTFAVEEIIAFLEKKLSKVNSIVIDVRKEFRKRENDKRTQYETYYKDSKLIDKIIARMDYEENLKELYGEK